MSEVHVLPVPEGSIVWLHDVALRPEGNGELTAAERQRTLQNIKDALVENIGHDQFAVLFTEGGGEVEVLGPDDLVDRIRVAIGSEADVGDEARDG